MTLDRHWNGIGTGLKCDWNWNGIEMGLKWDWNGIRIGFIWDYNGIGLVLEYIGINENSQLLCGRGITLQELHCNTAWALHIWKINCVKHNWAQTLQSEILGRGFGGAVLIQSIWGCAISNSPKQQLNKSLQLTGPEQPSTEQLINSVLLLLHLSCKWLISH